MPANANAKTVYKSSAASAASGGRVTSESADATATSTAATAAAATDIGIPSVTVLSLTTASTTLSSASSTTASSSHRPSATKRQRRLRFIEPGAASSAGKRREFGHPLMVAGENLVHSQHQQLVVRSTLPAMLFPKWGHLLASTATTKSFEVAAKQHQTNIGSFISQESATTSLRNLIISVSLSDNCKRFIGGAMDPQQTIVASSWMAVPFLRQLGCTTDNTTPALTVPDANKQLDRQIMGGGQQGTSQNDGEDDRSDGTSSEYSSRSSSASSFASSTVGPSGYPLGESHPPDTKTPPVPAEQHPSGDFMPNHYGIRMPIPPMFAQWSAAQYEAERVGGVEALGRAYDDHARSLCRRAYLVRCHCLYVWLGVLQAEDDSTVRAIVGGATSATNKGGNVKISLSSADSWAEAMNSMLSEKLEEPYTSLDLDDLVSALSGRGATELVSEMSSFGRGSFLQDDDAFTKDVFVPASSSVPKADGGGGDSSDEMSLIPQSSKKNDGGDSDEASSGNAATHRIKERMASFILDMVQQRFADGGSDGDHRHNISAATTARRKAQRYQHLCQYIMLNVIRQLTELIRAVEPFTGAVGEVRPIPPSSSSRSSAMSSAMSLVRTIISPNARLPGFFVEPMRPFLQRLHSRLLLQRAYFLTVLSGCAALARQHEELPPPPSSALRASSHVDVNAPITTSGPPPPTTTRGGGVDNDDDDDRVRSFNEQAVINAMKGSTTTPIAAFQASGLQQQQQQQDPTGLGAAGTRRPAPTGAAIGFPEDSAAIPSKPPQGAGVDNRWWSDQLSEAMSFPMRGPALWGDTLDLPIFTHVQALFRKEQLCNGSLRANALLYATLDIKQVESNLVSDQRGGGGSAAAAPLPPTSLPTAAPAAATPPLPAVLYRDYCVELKSMVHVHIALASTIEPSQYGTFTALFQSYHENPIKTYIRARHVFAAMNALNNQARLRMEQESARVQMQVQKKNRKTSAGSGEATATAAFVTQVSLTLAQSDMGAFSSEVDKRTSMVDQSPLDMDGVPFFRPSYALYLNLAGDVNVHAKALWTLMTVHPVSPVALYGDTSVEDTLFTRALSSSREQRDQDALMADMIAAGLVPTPNATGGRLTSRVRHRTPCEPVDPITRAVLEKRLIVSEAEALHRISVLDFLVHICAADPRAGNRDKLTPLHAAAGHGQATVMRYLESFYVTISLEGKKIVVTVPHTGQPSSAAAKTSAEVPAASLFFHEAQPWSGLAVGYIWHYGVEDEGGPLPRPMGTESAAPPPRREEPPTVGPPQAAQPPTVGPPRAAQAPTQVHHPNPPTSAWRHDVFKRKPFTKAQLQLFQLKSRDVRNTITMLIPYHDEEKHFQLSASRGVELYEERTPDLTFSVPYIHYHRLTFPASARAGGSGGGGGVETFPGSLSNTPFNMVCPKDLGNVIDIATARLSAAVTGTNGFGGQTIPMMETATAMVDSKSYFDEYYVVEDGGRRVQPMESGQRRLIMISAQITDAADDAAIKKAIEAADKALRDTFEPWLMRHPRFALLRYLLDYARSPWVEAPLAAAQSGGSASSGGGGSSGTAFLASQNAGDMTLFPFRPTEEVRTMALLGFVHPLVHLLLGYHYGRLFPEDVSGERFKKLTVVEREAISADRRLYLCSPPIDKPKYLGTALKNAVTLSSTRPSVGRLFRSRFLCFHDQATAIISQTPNSAVYKSLDWRWAPHSVSRCQQLLMMTDSVRLPTSVLSEMWTHSTFATKLIPATRYQEGEITVFDYLSGNSSASTSTAGTNVNTTTTSTRARRDHPGSKHIMWPVAAFTYNQSGNVAIVTRRADGSLDGVMLNECEAWDMIKQIAKALNFLHSVDVAHLDVKPANILYFRGKGKEGGDDAALSPPDDDDIPVVVSPQPAAAAAPPLGGGGSGGSSAMEGGGTVHWSHCTFKLADFGLAAKLRPGPLPTGGTRAFMAPEVISNLRQSATNAGNVTGVQLDNPVNAMDTTVLMRSDVYSLGVAYLRAVVGSGIAACARFVDLSEETKRRLVKMLHTNPHRRVSTDKMLKDWPSTDKLLKPRDGGGVSAARNRENLKKLNFHIQKHVEYLTADGMERIEADFREKDDALNATVAVDDSSTTAPPPTSLQHMQDGAQSDTLAQVKLRRKTLEEQRCRETNRLWCHAWGQVMDWMGANLEALVEGMMMAGGSEDPTDPTAPNSSQEPPLPSTSSPPPASPVIMPPSTTSAGSATQPFAVVFAAAGPAATRGVTGLSDEPCDYWYQLAKEYRPATLLGTAVHCFEYSYHRMARNIDVDLPGFRGDEEVRSDATVVNRPQRGGTSAATPGSGVASASGVVLPMKNRRAVEPFNYDQTELSKHCCRAHAIIVRELDALLPVVTAVAAGIATQASSTFVAAPPREATSGDFKTSHGPHASFLLRRPLLQCVLNLGSGQPTLPVESYDAVASAAARRCPPTAPRGRHPFGSFAMTDDGGANGRHSDRSTASSTTPRPLPRFGGDYALDRPSWILSAKARENTSVRDQFHQTLCWAHAMASAVMPHLHYLAEYYDGQSERLTLCVEWLKKHSTPTAATTVSDGSGDELKTAIFRAESLSRALRQSIGWYEEAKNQPGGGLHGIDPLFHDNYVWTLKRFIDQHRVTIASKDGQMLRDKNGNDYALSVSRLAFAMSKNTVQIPLVRPWPHLPEAPVFAYNMFAVRELHDVIDVMHKGHRVIIAFRSVVRLAHACATKTYFTLHDLIPTLHNVTTDLRRHGRPGEPHWEITPSTSARFTNAHAITVVRIVEDEACEWKHWSMAKDTHSDAKRARRAVHNPPHAPNYNSTTACHTGDGAECTQSSSNPNVDLSGGGGSAVPDSATPPLNDMERQVRDAWLRDRHSRPQETLSPNHAPHQPSAAIKQKKKQHIWLLRDSVLDIEMDALAEGFVQPYRCLLQPTEEEIYHAIQFGMLEVLAVGLVPVAKKDVSALMDGKSA